MTHTPAYDALKQNRQRIHNLEYVQAVATWDRLTFMPSGSAAARAAAQAELATVIQRMQSDAELDVLIERARAEPLDTDDAANLALMDRDRLVARAIPEELLVRRAMATAATAQVWPEARAANDWAPFAAALAPVVDCVRESADRLGDALELGRYDALLDSFDPGLRTARVETLFADIADWLPAMVDTVKAAQRDEPDPVAPVGPFEVEAQRRVGINVMKALGFDFTAGRLDVSHHPFTGGTSDDVRLTTRYREDQCLPALLGIIHETGHGLYQAGLPRRWRGQPLGEACSASVHEAQALMFERQLAPTPGFAALLSRLLGDEFGAQPAFDPENIVRLLTRVRPRPIRVESDELTYPAHVILRTEIERLLIEGDIQVDDIPAMWDERMLQLLGVDTRGDFANGPLQDVHWAQGMFGYFPAYLIGAMAAAQLAAAFAQQASDGREMTGAALAQWLAPTVWSRGARLTTEALIEAATGAPLSADALRRHFRRRYGPA